MPYRLPVNQLILHHIALKLIRQRQSKSILVIALSLHFLIRIHILYGITSFWNAQLLVPNMNVLHVICLFQIVFLYRYSFYIAFDIFNVMIVFFRFCLVYVAKYVQVTWDRSHHEVDGELAVESLDWAWLVFEAAVFASEYELAVLFVDFALELLIAYDAFDDVTRNWAL